MKRRLAIFLSLICVLTLGACGAAQPQTAGTTTTQQAPATSAATTAEPTSTAPTQPEPETGLTIETAYYTLTAPASWKDDCYYKVREGDSYRYTLDVYDKISRLETDGTGGWLFSVELLLDSEDYTGFPNYEVLGSLEVYRIGDFNLVVTYPTDVQFSDNTVEKYQEMAKEIPAVLRSVSFAKGSTFSDKPLPVATPTEPEPQITKSFVGKWFCRASVFSSRLPDNANQWNAEFRTDGTGTFQYIFEADDVVTVNFEYETFDAALDRMDGIRIRVAGGRDILYTASYSWSNEMQKMMLFLNPAKEDGFPNTDIHWMFVNF